MVPHTTFTTGKQLCGTNFVTETLFKQITLYRPYIYSDVMVSNSKYLYSLTGTLGTLGDIDLGLQGIIQVLCNLP